MLESCELKSSVRNWSSLSGTIILDLLIFLDDLFILLNNLLLLLILLD